MTHSNSVLLSISLAWLLSSSTVHAQNDPGTVRVVSDDVTDGGVVTGRPGDEIEIVFRVELETQATEVTAVEASVSLRGPESVQLQNNPDEQGCDSQDEDCASLLAWPDGDGEAFFYVSELVDPEYEPLTGPLAGSGPQGPGLRVGLVAALVPRQHFNPGTSTLAVFRLTAPILADPSGYEVGLVFQDGLSASGADSFWSTGVVFTSETFTPVKENLTFTVRALAPTENFLPGDTDGDGDSTLMDILDYLDLLFLGEPTALPCGDRTMDDASNVQVLDSNGDGELDIADALYSLRSQFLNGPPHELGEGCARIAGCPEICEG